MTRVAVFTGSATGARGEYATAVAEVGRCLASAGVGIVYGGGRWGLMGVLADAAIAEGGEVIGVSPTLFPRDEVLHPGITRLELVASMHQRKARMTELADAMVALPGGIGTLDEFVEAWTWRQLGLHAKPVILYEVGGFWDDLRSLLRSMVNGGFLAEGFAATLQVVDDPEELLAALPTR